MKKCLILVFFALLGKNLGAVPVEIDQIRIDSLLSEISVMDNDSLKVKKILSIVDLYPDVYPEKLKYAKDGLNVAKRIDWADGVGLCYYYIAWSYFYTNERDLAIGNFFRAIEYSKNASILVYSYGCIANIYSWDKKHDLAHTYASRGLEIAKASGDSHIEAEALIFLGDVFRYQDNMVDAKGYYLTALSIMNDDNSALLSLSKMSLYVYLMGSEVDSPFHVLNFAFRLKNAYDYANPREKQIQILTLIKIALAYVHSSEKENIKKVELEAEEKQKNIYIGGIILLIIITGILVWQNYSRKKAIEALAKANEMKSRFFGILNHDLRSPVAGLISYLQLKTDAPDIINSEDAKAFEEQTIITAKKLLENMEDLLFWCKDQMQSFTPEFTLVPVKKLFDETKNFFSYQERIQLSFNDLSDLKIKTDENYVKTIMRNLTSNAIAATSHLETPVIVWDAYEENGYTILAVTNNGTVISQDKIDILYNNTERNTKEGLGLKIIRDLAISINCRIEVGTDDAKGTTFKLIF